MKTGRQSLKVCAGMSGSRPARGTRPDSAEADGMVRLVEAHDPDHVSSRGERPRTSILAHEEVAWRAGSIWGNCRDRLDPLLAMQLHASRQRKPRGGQ